MKRLSWKFAIGFLTFFVGITLTLTRISFESDQAQSNELSTASKPEAEPSRAAAETIDANDAAYLQGKKDARRDAKAGRLIIKVKGQTRFGAALEQEMSKHKVEVETIGCFFDEAAEKHLRGYNEISKSAIAGKIGNDVLEAAIRKASENDGDVSQ